MRCTAVPNSRSARPGRTTIARTLDGLGIAHRTVARTGVLARIEGRGNLRRAVVLRADIDALPIREQADVAWRSLNDG